MKREGSLAVAQRMSVEDYERFVLSGVEGAWELHNGILVEKIRMGVEQGVIPALLGHLLLLQIDRGAYHVVTELRVRQPTAAGYDLETKIPVYMLRGDLEIWRVHPYERTVTSWVRQADGTYQDTVYTSGTIRLAALPGVEIAVDDIFDF